MEDAASSTTFSPQYVNPTLLQAVEDNLDISFRAQARISGRIETVAQLAQGYRAKAEELVRATSDTQRQHMRKATDLKEESADVDTVQKKVTDAIKFMLGRKWDWERWIEIGHPARIVDGKVLFEKPEDADTLNHIKKRQQGEILEVEETYVLIRGLPVAFHAYRDVEGANDTAPSCTPSDANAHDCWNLE